MNSGLIARIMAGGMALSVLGVSLRYGSQYDSIEEGIQALKEKGRSFYNQYLVSEEEKQALQGEFDTLKTQYLGVLEKLGLGENATLEDIQSKLDSLAQGGANEVITDIAELLGIENAENATITTITEAIADLAEAVTQLEADISRLQTELEQANLDLAQANKEEEDTVEALNNALAELNALGGRAPGAGEEEEEGGEPVEGPELTEEQQALQEAMNTAWASLEVQLASDGIESQYYEEIRAGNFTLNTNGSATLYVGETAVKNNVTTKLKRALNDYRTALDNYNASLQ